MSIRSIILALLILALVHISMEFTLEKRGAAWFLRPNWRPPAKRFFYPDGASVGGIPQNSPDFDQYIIY